jgi:predicted RNase H-like HicB family nuclease
MKKRLTGIIKKHGKFYVGLCMELNVASQGETLEQARNNLIDACNEYLAFLRENHLEKTMRPADMKILKTFMLTDIDEVRLSHDWKFSENISFELVAGV